MENLAAAALRVLVATDSRTALCQRFEKSPPVMVPTTLAEADALREWALATQPERPEGATLDQLARHLEFIAAVLPSRANDVETGRKRVAVYASILSGHSNEALAHMARRACESLEWFPSPKQCLEFLAEYRTPRPLQETALLTCAAFVHRSFDSWIRELREGGPIGDVPDQWKRIAVEQGALRRMDGGVYVNRALYHGPPRPPFQPRSLPRSATRPTASASHRAIAGASQGLVA
ncbi:MAG: hypothetical protein JWR80_8109 [Bradyrhizobium sp.]|nr:hypothetical protein [Bradyrhizobium sp.]